MQVKEEDKMNVDNNNNQQQQQQQPNEETYLNSLSKEELIEIILKKNQQQSNGKQTTTSTTSTQNKPTTNKKKDKKSKRKATELDFDRFSRRFVALKVAYLGWHYHGFAAQQCTEETIEGHLFSALQKTCLIRDIKECNYTKSGRTDKGVSAFGQVISLYVRSNLKQGDGIIPPVIPDDDNKNQQQKNKNNNKKNNNHVTPIEYPYVRMLNGVLPPYIRVLAWTPVPFHFNARFSTLYRTYKYYFNPAGLDIEAMKEAGNHFLGSHDFSNFCKIDLEAVKSFTRVILSFDIAPVPVGQFQSGGLYEATICGYAFLWHQIRCMMAMLLLIGQKKFPTTIIKDLLDTSSAIAKPSYEMASEIPLVLYDCGYEDLEFIYENDSHQKLISSMFNVWNDHYIKAAVSSLMINSLKEIKTFTIESTNPNTNSNSNSNEQQQNCTNKKGKGEDISLDQKINNLDPKRKKLYLSKFGETTTASTAVVDNSDTSSSSLSTNSTISTTTTSDPSLVINFSK
ncbi:tRNA pseudouridylate synthase [Cavenderia fasciculata]|uniref:tRNA pseudouridylate synthase n=1 Tax=Cavenderia fasciculata TaxID=261658 RepID=F4PSG5_CACFS|nr:tRNA pseudouridylate synthase [Cavenderia fasciculata]EGG21495.1 tRNA pseudouridylate synthase [Cavenderia fasciculata]|eukprot:XP_004359345.1 tRNA pseudouridylate synthase [Cavenderia fasciculata]